MTEMTEITNVIVEIVRVQVVHHPVQVMMINLSDQNEVIRVAVDPDQMMTGTNKVHHRHAEIDLYRETEKIDPYRETDEIADREEVVPNHRHSQDDAVEVETDITAETVNLIEKRAAAEVEKIEWHRPMGLRMSNVGQMINIRKMNEDAIRRIDDERVAMKKVNTETIEWAMSPVDVMD